METFFEDSVIPRYWIHDASIKQISCGPTWPPVISAVGYAPCLRAWKPESAAKRSTANKVVPDVEVQFVPAPALAELDGARFIAAHVHEGVLVAASTTLDGSPGSLVSIWETHSWRRLQTIKVDHQLVSLTSSPQHIAAGTTSGHVIIWTRTADEDASAPFSTLFAEPLRLDPMCPVYSLCLGVMPDGAAMLAAHCMGPAKVGVWNLATGKLLCTLGQQLPLFVPGEAEPGKGNAAGSKGAIVPSSSSSPPSPVDNSRDELLRLNRDRLLASNALFMCLFGGEIACVCYEEEGGTAALHLLSIKMGGGAVAEDCNRMMQGHGRPTAADYDGAHVAIGFADGTILSFGKTSWTRSHDGAVGSVICLPHRHQIASGAADCLVRLWHADTGDLVSEINLGFQVTCLAQGGSGLALTAGGNRGQMQIAILDVASASKPAESDEKGDFGESSNNGKGTASDASASMKGPRSCRRFELYFDNRVKGLPESEQKRGRVDENLSTFEKFVPPRRLVTLDLLRQMASAAQKDGKEAHGRSDLDSDSGSEFGSNKLGGSGAPESPAPPKGASEMAKHQQLKAMGETTGVARSGGCVHLESSSAAQLGRKCSSDTCLVREGVGLIAGAKPFQRCGGCRSAWYCSTHCQATHWRRGHKQQCQALAAALLATATPTTEEATPPPGGARPAAGAPAEITATSAAQPRQEPQREAGGRGHEAPVFSEEGRGSRGLRQGEDQEQEREATETIIGAQEAMTAVGLYDLD